MLDNTATDPHTVKLVPPLDINSSQWGEVNTIVKGFPNKYVVLDLSECMATGDTISGAGSGSSPSGNDMNVIGDTSNITGIVLPSNLATIGDFAFAGCYSLTSITIPDGVISIGMEAFRSCSLTSISIPDSVTTIDWGAFTSSGLTSIPIHNGVTTIGRLVFQNCRFSSITIPDNITSIGELAFYVCPNLTNVRIPSSVTGIGNNAFLYCINLTSVTFEAGSNIAVADFDTSAFDGDLTTKYLMGGPGTYRRSPGGSDWTKQ